jgi:hypothetical protein
MGSIEASPCYPINIILPVFDVEVEGRFLEDFDKVSIR